MKTIILIATTLLLSSVGYAQITEEQKKQMQKAERMRDSIMNSPMFKKAIQQAKDAEKMMPKSIKEKSIAEDQKRKAKKESNHLPKKSTSHLKHMIITSDNQKKFENWSYGEAEIYAVFYSYNGKETFEKKVGEFNAKGEFTLKDKGFSVSTDTPVNKFFKCQNPSQKTQYSNEEAHVGKGFLGVKKGNKHIGTLNIGTSKQSVYNNSPAGFYRGDKGYVSQLYFATEPVVISGKCISQRKATDHGEIEEQIEVTDIYNISFKKGLNFTKEEVVNSKNIGKIPYYTTKKYTLLHNNDPQARWVFSYAPR